MSAATAASETLREQWLATWPAALSSWSRFVRLRPPTLCLTRKHAKAEGLTGSFAMIRLVDQAVVVSLPEVVASGVQGFAHEILAHEIGHHVLAPATLTDHGRTIARMRWSLPTVERHAPMVANLYTDLFINDRLQRSAGLRMAGVYRALRSDKPAGALWAVYMRIYELLWALPRRTLGAPGTDDRQEGDAHLGARLVRSYAHDWLEGSGRFAALMLPYLLEDTDSLSLVARLFDTKDAGRDGELDGLADEDARERAGAVHPAEDAERTDGPSEPPPLEPPKDNAQQAPSQGQARQPFEYGEILRAAGLRLTDEDVAMRYYREKAFPHIVRYPRRSVPSAHDPLPEGLEPWELGDPMDAVDWLQSLLISPRLVPGVTTVQRVWGTNPGRDRADEPIDLDLYVDSSGSMLDPRRQLSFPTLAATIICLSGLRVGARIQATLWSGPHQCAGTEGFVRDRSAVLSVLTGHYGGSTAFPIHRLRDTYAKRKPDARPAHVMVVSDDGVSTMFDKDERGQSGFVLAREALAKARGGATFVLNLSPDWERDAGDALVAIRRARDELGITIARVTAWDELVAFARTWSRSTYGGTRVGG